MKKLYHKGTVHPSPPVISDQLSFLPATILTLTAALSPEDREVLAYLLSSSSANFSANPRRNTNKGTVVDGDHGPLFNCSCFRCYMSYWVRWDESPNRQLIHEIIDAFEDWLAQNNKKGGKKGRKEKRNKKGSNNKHSGELKRSELTLSSGNNESGESESVGESSTSGGGGEAGERVVDEEKGSVRRLMGFIGEKIWGAWGQ